MVLIKENVETQLFESIYLLGLGLEYLAADWIVRPQKLCIASFAAIALQTFATVPGKSLPGH